MQEHEQKYRHEQEEGVRLNESNSSASISARDPGILLKNLLRVSPMSLPVLSVLMLPFARAVNFAPLRSPLEHRSLLSSFSFTAFPQPRAHILCR